MGRILIVDDHSDVRDLLAMVVEASGHEPVKAASGPEALRVVDAQPPALVLLDVSMPEMNGLEVLNALRTPSAGTRVPVIMLTAMDDDTTRQQAAELGARDFLVKGKTDLSAMLASIAQHAAA